MIEKSKINLEEQIIVDMEKDILSSAKVYGLGIAAQIVVKFLEECEAEKDKYIRAAMYKTAEIPRINCIAVKAILNRILTEAKVLG